jgi:hypothetical protein
LFSLPFPPLLLIVSSTVSALCSASWSRSASRSGLLSLPTSFSRFKSDDPYRNPLIFHSLFILHRFSLVRIFLLCTE